MLKLLLDEDIKARTLIRLLREAGHDVLTTSDFLIDGFPDMAVLECGIREERVVVTYNCGDFRALHALCPNHFGVVAIYQEPGKSMSYSEIVTALGNMEKAMANASLGFQILNQWLF
jgi:predicted nuclease of predicted toxin-antitoxin system